MNEAHDPNRTVDVPSTPADSLDAGLAAGFGPPRSSLGDMRPPLLKEAEGDSAQVIKPKSDAMPPPAQTGDRYQLQGEIARGGMGAVLRGRDVDLGRDLAIKVLLEKHAHRPEVARRFVEEAQIGGQLQHPGVVPVYDIGRFGERPFFTMKLVKGQTLAALLGERASASPVASAPGELGAPTQPRSPHDLPRFLAIALQVAQTLAYAHAKGVIHRDLKPANIMVGAFGEVQVMDWGLAKVLPEGGVADEEKASRMHSVEGTQIRTARSSGSGVGTDTEAGSLLGTPAYMPPEQANGDVALLDRRTDVFGLGAILCEILTGKPPYVGRSGEEVRRKAANGDLADAMARVDACEAEAELIALTKTCLAAQALDRPKDAQEVADALSAYLNGVQERLQAAQRERAVALAREAEQRKRRKVQLALAAAVVALLLGGGAFAFWRNAQAQAGRERDARNAEAVAALLGQVEEALKADDAAKATVALEAAKKRSAEGGAEQQAQRLRGLEADLKLLRDLDAVDQFRWTVVENKKPDAAAVATRTREALARFGADPEAVSADEAAARVSASVVRERIVAALDRLLRYQKTAGARALLRRVDADPYRDAIRDAVVAEDRAKLVHLASQKEALEQAPGFTAFLGESQALAVPRRRQLLQAALSRRPGDLGLLMTLGSSYAINHEDDANERLRWFQAAVAAAPANADAHNGLGVALKVRGQLDEAIACYQKAIALDPRFAGAHYNVGHVLADKGQVDEAIACYRKAIALDPKFAMAHFGLGVVLANKGQVDEAIVCYQRAIAFDPNFAHAHNGLGFALYGKGEVDEAIACYKKAIALDPKDALPHYNLGSALYGKGQVDEAIACYKKAIALDPKNADAHNALGIALRTKGQVDEAIACYKKAIALDPKDALPHHNLGSVLYDGKGQVDEAIACFRKAIALDPKYAKAHAALGAVLHLKGQVDEAIACYKKATALDPKLAMAHTNLGSALKAKGQVDEAIASYKKAIELGSKDPLAHDNLGLALKAKGQVDEAVACYKKAIALDPKYALAHFNLGGALLDKGQVEEAIASYQKAIELDPKYAPAHSNLGAALAGKGQVDEAIASYKKAIKLDPKHAKAYTNLGNALAGKGQVDEAIACYKKAIALDPKLALAHSNLGAALDAKGQVDEAIACLRKAIALDPKDALAHSNLGIALAGKGQLDEAIACWRKAIELDPKNAKAHAALGIALRTKGQVDEAIACYKKAIALDPKLAGVRTLLAQAERLAAVRDKLPAYQNSSYTPASNAERLDLAEWCKIKKLYHSATRLCAATFATDPKLADDLGAAHRYNAACYAALAAAGQGEDAAQLDDKEKARLRQQALDWLRADLALRTKQMRNWWPGEAAQARTALVHWQKDSDLAGLRDAAALAKLPAEERAACEKLWADVAALLKQAEMPGTKEGK
jgi:tetratricopeptide (TPR) repeat protein